MDNDGVWSEDEMQDFQVSLLFDRRAFALSTTKFSTSNLQERCYNTPLLPQAMDEVRSCISKHLPQGVKDNGITLDGTYP